MYVVRPVELADIAALEALAAVPMPGVHTLPKTREKILAMIERSIASFAAHVDIPSEEAYVLVLESLADHGIVGTAAMFAAAGSNGTYFSFRNDVIQQVSRDLNISHSVHALTLCSELTGYSQLSSFYVGEREYGTPEAALLSRARLLYALLAPHRFGERFFVPLAGLTDEAGQSPFWDALGVEESILKNLRPSASQNGDWPLRSVTPASGTKKRSPKRCGASMANSRRARDSSAGSRPERMCSSM